MPRLFDLHGLASLAVHDDRDQVCRYLDSQLDPYEPSRGTALEEPDVVLNPKTKIVPDTLCDVQGPAGDGRRTASDGERCYLLHGDYRFEVPRLHSPLTQVPIAYELEFPFWQGFHEVVRPLLQIATLRHGAITVHGAAVQVGQEGLLICGWAETGKTETALALAEEGARFISDKWAIIDSGVNIHAFPVSVGIRDWVLEYLPRLRAHLRASRRARLLVSRTAGRSVPLVARTAATPIGGVIASQLRGALALASRISLRQTEVAAVYGVREDTARTPPLTKLAILTTVSPSQQVSVHEADLDWTANRLARSAAYERRTLYELDARARYATGQAGRSPLGEVPDVEAEMLRTLLENVQLLEVRAPFPTDPRKVADAVAQWC
jgi:hypothetical protein